MNKEKENSFQRFSNQRSHTYINSNSSGLTNNYKSSQSSTIILPPLKEMNKFSSWTDSSLIEEELINENELI